MMYWKGVGQIHMVSDGLDNEVLDRGRTHLHCQRCTE